MDTDGASDTGTDTMEGSADSATDTAVDTEGDTVIPVDTVDMVAMPAFVDPMGMTVIADTVVIESGKTKIINLHPTLTKVIDYNICNTPNNYIART